MTNYSLSQLLALIIVTLSLTACGGAVDQTVTFYKNESWTAETRLSLPGELVHDGLSKACNSGLGRYPDRAHKKCWLIYATLH
jgi:hypothetical protein